MIALALALSVAAVPPCALREPPTAAGALAAEHAWVAAIEHRDAAALACLLDPRFVDTNWRGDRVPRATMLAGFAGKPPVRLTLDQLSVDMRGSIAIVRGRNRQTDAAGAVRFTDVFVYAGGAWRAVSAQETVIR